MHILGPLNRLNFHSLFSRFLDPFSSRGASLFWKGFGLTLWAGGTALWARTLVRYPYRFPRADDENFAEVITGYPVSLWHFVWTPGNEHYSPLVRLYDTWVGRLTGWNIPAMLYIQMALLSVAILIWVSALARRQGAWTGWHLAAIAIWFSPAAFETWLSTCSYGPMVPAFLTFSAIYLEGGWERSRCRWLAMVTLLLLTFFSGLLVGGLFVFGFCLDAIFRAGFRWRAEGSRSLSFSQGTIALLGALIVLGVVLVVLKTPQPGHHVRFRAASLGEFIHALAAFFQFGLFAYLSKQAGTWWSILFVVTAAIAGVQKWRAGEGRRGHAFFLGSLGFLLLGMSLAYGRANYSHLTSRYFVMIAPFWIFLFLYLFVENRAARRWNLLGWCFLFITLSVTYRSYRVGLVPAAQELRDRDAIVLQQLREQSPVAATLAYTRMWGQRPGRMLEIIELQKAAGMGVFPAAVPHPIVWPDFSSLPQFIEQSEGPFARERIEAGRPCRRTLPIPAGKRLLGIALFLRADPASEIGGAGELEISLTPGGRWARPTASLRSELNTVLLLPQPLPTAGSVEVSLQTRRGAVESWTAEAGCFPAYWLAVQ